jgi:hypothetical protein
MFALNIYQFYVNQNLKAELNDSSQKLLQVEENIVDFEDVQVSSTGETEIADKYIKIVNIEDNSTLFDQPIEFKGMVSSNVKKIIVTATGKDIYTLNEFKYGDGNFTYKASTQFGNLELGSNEYSFEAFFDDGSTQSVILTVFYVED